MKKAIAVTELVIILLVAGAGIALLLYAGELKEKLGCKQDIELCRQSFQMFKRIKEKLPVAPRIDCVATSPPNCEKTRFETTDKRQTMHTIAENLRWCWDKTLGATNTMGEDFAAGFLGRVAGQPDRDFCLVCSYFTPQIEISAKEWNDYLDTQNVPGRGQTYEEFLNPIDPVIWEQSYRDIAFTPGQTNNVVSVSAEGTKGDNQVFIYISTDITCGPSKEAQIHYQLAHRST